MVRGFDHGLQFLRRVVRDHAPRGDRNLLTGLGVTTRTLRLFAEPVIAEAVQLHAFARLERDPYFLEEALDHVFRFALVEPELFEQQVREFSFGERHCLSYVRNVAPKRCASSATMEATVASMSASVKVR